MTRSTAIGSLCAAIAATMLVSAPVAARPHHGQRQICKVEKHHGKRIRTCHWMRR
jgi:hypothetical protein